MRNWEQKPIGHLVLQNCWWFLDWKIINNSLNVIWINKKPIKRRRSLKMINQLSVLMQVSSLVKSSNCWKSHWPKKCPWGITYCLRPIIFVKQWDGSWIPELDLKDLLRGIYCKTSLLCMINLWITVRLLS